MAQPALKQTLKEREYLLANLPAGTRRVQVRNPQGKVEYKPPADVDIIADEVLCNNQGIPIVMRRKPGRRPKGLMPVSPQINEISEAREDHLEVEAVLLEVRRNPEGNGAIEAVLRAMAKEAASIEFDRVEAQRHGQETANLASKRSRILKAMADLMLKRQALKQEAHINVEGDEFKALFGYALETFQESMVDSGVRSEMIETVFTKLTGSLDDSWTQEAKRRMREASK